MRRRQFSLVLSLALHVSLSLPLSSLHRHEEKAPRVTERPNGGFEVETEGVGEKRTWWEGWREEEEFVRKPYLLESKT